MFFGFIRKDTCAPVSFRSPSHITRLYPNSIFNFFRTRKCDIEDEMADAKKTTDALRKENDAVNKKVKVLKNQLQE